MDEKKLTKLKEATAEFVTTVMKDAKSPETIAAMMDELHSRSNKLAEKVGKATESSIHIDCHQGCGACCVVNVGILLPEAVAITHYLHAQGQERWEEARERIETLYRHIRWLSTDERAAMHKRCAFLDDEGSCTIYPVRPLMCRSVTSTSAATCRDALAMQALGEQPLVVMNLVHKRLFETFMKGLEEGLREVGAEARQFEMTAALIAIILDPESAGLPVS